MNLLSRLRQRERAVSTVDDYAQLVSSFSFQGQQYPYMSGGSPAIQQTLAGQATEMAPNDFVGKAAYAFAASGPVFACMSVRQLVFSSVRFRWQRLRDGAPADSFGTRDLRVLERPWIGGTTQDLLSRMIQDADLAGNAYVVRQGDELVRLRPDWVDIVAEERQDRFGRGQIGWRKVGYLYWPNGRQAEAEPTAFLADEVAHFHPTPDPLYTFRGMSWLTPLLREIQTDHAMTRHQTKFFDNGATPNLVVKHFPGAPGIQGATIDQIKRFSQELDEKSAGVENAWKTMHLYPGADVTVVGSNFQDNNFEALRAMGETRIAEAAGVPAVIAGFSKGLESSTYSNYSQARRRFADGTAHPLWENLSGTLERVVPPPDEASRLWYDASNVPFLREDEADAANIQQTRASTISGLIAAGYKPESVVHAVQNDDFRLLNHTGLVSVQLLPPGAEHGNPSDGGSNDDN